MRKQFAALLFLTSIARAATPAPAPAPQHWTEIRSQHFLVLTDSSEKDARRIAIQFERMRSVFHILLPETTADSGQITVLALKDKKGFQAFEPATYLGNSQLNLADLFLRTPDTNYILIRLDAGTGQEHPFATVYHAYTQLLTSKFQWLPLWINEGLAEFYQNTEIGDKLITVGQPSEADVRGLSDDNDLYIRHQIPLPLPTLLAVDRNSPYAQGDKKGSVFHAESWALTHFLIVSDHDDKTHRLDDYFANLIKGQDSVTAAQNAFGDLKKLQDSLAFYVKTHLDFYNPQYRFSYFQLPMTSTVDESAFKVQPVSTADADAIRADVLISDGRKDEAVTLLNDTLRDDPQNALAHETMGLLKLRENDFAAARKWFDQAVQLNSPSYLSYYYSAVLALRDADSSNTAAIESSLQTSIRLDPTFAAAYDALAQFYANQPDKFAAAHRLNLQAIQLDPANIGYRLHEANVLMLQQQPDAAIDALKEAEHVASTPAELAQIHARLEQVEQSKAAKANPQPAAADTTSVHVIADATPATPHFPTDPPTGPQHIANGIVRNVQCYAPAILSLDLESNGKSVTYYMNDYLKVQFYNLNFVPNGALNPCTDIDGMKAAVHYTAVTSPTAAGQIVRIDLTKQP